MTQRGAILQHLRDHGSITPIEALEGYGVYRLSSIINRLRNSGIEIDTERVDGVGRYGPLQYARYRLRH